MTDIASCPTYIGIFGGTFDPIHLGHLIFASLACDDLELERVLFMPAQTPPHKLNRDVSPAEMRVKMIRAAIEHDPRFDLSEADLTSSEPSYTSHLLERLHDSMPGNEFIFLIGADSLSQFPKWHEPERILELARIGVMQRQGSPISPGVLDAVPGLRDRTVVLDSPRVEISSTDIRQRLRSGRTVRWLVTDEVRRLIRHYGLYT